MKTAKQWANRVQNSKEPWEKLVWEIQSDAMQYAASICIAHANSGNTEGRTDTVSRECANLIEEKRVDAMPNESSSRLPPTGSVERKGTMEISETTERKSGAAVLVQRMVSRLRDNELYVDACDEAADTLERLSSENEKMRGIIARNSINETGNELNVLEHLTSTPANIHEIAARTGIKVTEVDVPLCKLVKLGFAKRATGEGNRNLYSK